MEPKQWTLSWFLLSYLGLIIYMLSTQKLRFSRDLFPQHLLSSKIAIRHMWLVSIKYMLDFEDNINKVCKGLIF